MYKLVVSNRFKKNYKKLDKNTANIIEKWIDNNLVSCENPRQKGKCLRGKYEGYWRYRIGNYRLIVKIMDQQLVIVAISIGHRRDVYR